MPPISTKMSALTGLLVGLAVIGSVTALAITGHIPGGDALAVLTLVGGGTSGIVGAHVGGTVATNASGSTPAPPVQQAEPGSSGPAAPAGVPTAAIGTATGV